MGFPRSSGILLHPTSLPGRYGIGDLGKSAYDFVDFLAGSGQSLWQVLPLGPTGYGDSPYQCFSAIAGNTLLISFDRLIEVGVLLPSDLQNVPEFSLDRVEFGRVIDFKNAILYKAFENFRQSHNHPLRPQFDEFCANEASWLDDYALYRALKGANENRDWSQWSEEHVRRDPAALATAREIHSDAIQAQKFYQFLFYEQWMSLKRHCADRNIKIIGDVPIYVAFDSADVWTNPHQFKLDEKRKPTVVAGVPPDYFSSTGQLWGNPMYDWERMKSDGFKWWIDRIRATMRFVDVIRLDHFRGFAACWEVPAGEQTAQNGHWVPSPGRELFDTLKSKLGELPIIAEDLGVITPDVEALRDDYGLPGMRILQFAFSSDTKNIDLPHNYIHNTVVYTGTHDNDTTVGWFNSKAGTGSTRSAEQIDRERNFSMKYLKSDGREIHWDFIRAAFASVADTALVPLQDLLGLGTDARMNLPASPGGNWSWRFREESLTNDIAERLKELTYLYGREPETRVGDQGAGARD
ncbi:MAG TPA: 4-alpha-glucanotransferase [Blastocatellia bacterium]|nr:4-alpha-glucanotransferase [Blastocatellia bacterium]